MKGAGIVRGNALCLPLRDESVDLIVTSPPYFALRSYRDGGEHYGGQIGSEDTPVAFLLALWAVLDECWRVLKPTGSCWVNLGDKYAGAGGHNNGAYGVSGLHKNRPSSPARDDGVAARASLRNAPDRYNQSADVLSKSVMGLPWRFALGASCPEPYRTVYEPGEHPQWLNRRPHVWEKPNGLPESVTDRSRANFEDWFHLTKQGRYYSAIDEIREHYDEATATRYALGWKKRLVDTERISTGYELGGNNSGDDGPTELNPLGKLPGSVWRIATEPLVLSEEVRNHYGLPDHFACVDTDTEVLTRRGWLRHDEVLISDEVAGYNLDTGMGEWTRCHGVHHYDYDGEIIAVDKPGLSMRLTPNHRTIVRRPHSVTPTLDEVIDADQLGPRYAVPRSADFIDPDPWKPIGIGLAALCGWIAAEGWYDAGKSVRLSQSLTANPEHVAKIDRLLPSAARRVAIRTYKGQPWQDVTWTLPAKVATEVRRLMPDKRLNAALVNLPEDERRALFDAFVDGDGHRRPDGRIAVFQKDRTNLDWLQIVAVSLGYRTRLSKGEGRWVLYCNSGHRPITLRATNGRNVPVAREHYQGTVWCPTTGTGTFFARRNGSVFITGNSFPQEIPRRIVLGWSPSAICCECGEGRRPVTDTEVTSRVGGNQRNGRRDGTPDAAWSFEERTTTTTTIVGWSCRCASPVAPTRPGVVLDPFSGTGTVAGVARALGRVGVGVDLSHDYCRLAQWFLRDGSRFAKTASRTDAERQGNLFGEVRRPTAVVETGDAL